MKPLKPDWLAFEDEDPAAQQRECDRRFKRNALISAAVCLAIAVISVAGQLSGQGMEAMLKRNPYGGGSKDISLDLKMSIDGKKYAGETDIQVQEAVLSEAEAYDLFERCAASLPRELAESFGNGVRITEDPELPSEWQSAVSLSWHSESPELMSDNGRPVLPQNAAADAIFTVNMSAGGHMRETSVILPLDFSGTDPKALAERLSADLSEELSSDSKGTSLALPKEYRGIGLEWSRPGIRFPSALIATLIFVLTALYFSRYDALKKEYEKRAAQFNASVPDLSLRLVLLLNAGLVLSSALEELLRQTRDDPSPLYRKMNEIGRRCSASNASFEAAFSEYAASTGNRDLMRIAAMIYENAGRGSELAGKLEAERGRQWTQRLNAAKAKAGEAETKLCLPLMILLIVLVIIAAAPALMNM